MPAFTPKVADSQAPENYVYTVKGDFGSFIATEPSDYLATQVIKWNAKSILFHYPAEHSNNGVTYDVEMQIYHEVRHDYQ